MSSKRGEDAKFRLQDLPANLEEIQKLSFSCRISSARIPKLATRRLTDLFVMSSAVALCYARSFKEFACITDHEEVEPDYFGYYTREIMELLSQEEDFLPFTSRTSELTERKYGGVRSMDTIGDSFSGIVSSFSKGIGAGLSDFKKER